MMVSGLLVWCALGLGAEGAQVVPTSPMGQDQKVRPPDLDLLDDLGLPPARIPSDLTVPGVDAGEDLGAARKTPIENVGLLMATVQSRLSQDDTSKDTQQLQAEIVAILDQLLELAAPMPQDASGQSEPTAGAPGDAAGQGGDQAARDRDAAGTPGAAGVRGGREAERALAEFWGDLPQRLREQLQVSAAVEFLPKYQALIEEYYRRLAESRSEDRRP